MLGGAEDSNPPGRAAKSPNRIKFSKERLDALIPPAKGWRFVFDSETRGLALGVGATGARTFYYYRWIQGRPERFKLGAYGDLTLDTARTKAAEANAEKGNGRNPAESRRALRKEATFADLFDHYLERHAKLKKRTWPEDQRCFTKHLSGLGRKRVSELKRRHFAEVHAEVTKRGAPILANRLLALASSVFGWAISAGLVDCANPVRNIARNTERERERFIQPGELPRFFEALRLEANAKLRDYLLLSLLTGARRSNVLAMRWRDVDLERAEWRIPETKNGEPLRVQLTGEAVAILRERQKAEEERAKRDQAAAIKAGDPDAPRAPLEFVFPGTGKRKGSHLIEPRKVWGRVKVRAELLGLVPAIAAAREWGEAERDRQAADALKRGAAALEDFRAMARASGIEPEAYTIADLRLHDLRRTLGSWQARTGASVAIIGKSLGHKSHQATRIYARLDADPVRDAMETATAAMLAAGGVKASAVVLPMRRKGRG
jgi:integrase